MKFCWFLCRASCRVITLLYCGLLTLGLAGLNIEWISLLQLGIYYGPKWPILFFSAVAFIPNSIDALKSKVSIFWVGLFCMIIWYQDIQISFPDANKTAITLVSINIGGGTNMQLLHLAILLEQPDVVLLQESSTHAMKDLFDDSWNTHCDGGLCIASRYQFTHIESYSRTLLGGWGTFMSTYEVLILGAKYRLANVHFETPRYALAAGFSSLFNSKEANSFFYVKQTQAQMVNQFLNQNANAIATGDFNMSVFEPQYRSYFSSFNNAINQAGWGINYTKYTNWHGIRIDHVIGSSQINFSSAGVMETHGGDHRGVIVKLNLNE